MGGRIEAKGRPRTWPYTCGIKDLDASHVLVRRGEMLEAEVAEFMRQVEEDLQRAGRARGGPPTVVIRSQRLASGQGPSPVRVEVRLPVPPGTLPPAGFESESVPAQPVAYTVHHGRADALGPAEAVLSDWVKMKSLAFVSEVRRVYLKRGKNPRKDVTEVQIPLSR